jgi:hypothetical protein
MIPENPLSIKNGRDKPGLSDSFAFELISIDWNHL